MPKQYDLNEIWIKTLAQIEVKIDSAGQFKTWFRDTKLIDINGRNAIVEVKNPYASEWLSRRYNKLIDDTISYVVGKELQTKFNINAQLGSQLTIDSVAPTELPAEFGLSQSSSINTKLREAGINEKYTLSALVVGEANNMAVAAAQAVIDKPGSTYNPLFIYGPTGVGKTHLAQAIGRTILERQPQKRIVYSSSEGFLNDMVKALRRGKNVEFRQQYRRIDCLIIDDIQFISGWERTQDEFFNTFNELYNADKQIILVSDRKPEQISGIDNRLKTRFMGGLAVEVMRPDFEMRLAIVQNKAQQKGLELNNEVVEFLAKHVTQSIRELEGAVQQIALFANLKHDGSSLSLKEIEKIIGIDPKSKREKAGIPQVLKTVATEFGVSLKDLKGERRTAEIALARQVAMYVLRDEYEYKLERIADALSRKDHTTVIHAIDKVRSKLNLSEGFAEQVIRIKEKLRNVGGDS